MFSVLQLDFTTACDVKRNTRGAKMKRYSNEFIMPPPGIVYKNMNSVWNFRLPFKEKLNLLLELDISKSSLKSCFIDVSFTEFRDRSQKSFI